jgi:hypothetical protein
MAQLEEEQVELRFGLVKPERDSIRRYSGNLNPVAQNGLQAIVVKTVTQ